MKRPDHSTVILSTKRKNALAEILPLESEFNGKIHSALRMCGEQKWIGGMRTLAKAEVVLYDMLEAIARIKTANAAMERHRCVRRIDLAAKDENRSARTVEAIEADAPELEEALA